MRSILLVAKRELSAYARSMLAYVIVASVLLIDGLYFYAFALSKANLSADVLRRFFDGASVTTMIAAVVLTMRLIAGEREAKTSVVLGTAPLSEAKVIAGKFMASMTLMTILTALTVYMPLMIFVNGRVSVGHIVVGYVGILLLAAASLAIGLFGSTLARTQPVASIVSASILGTLCLFWLLARMIEPPLKGFISDLSIYPVRQMDFMQGVLRADNVVYYAATAFFFLLLSTKVLETRRWR